MKKYLRIITALTFVFVVYSLVSCSQKAATPKSIEYVAMWNAGEPEALFLIDMMEKFKEETGISVEVTWAGRDNLNKLRTRFLSGDEPDLIDQGFSELGALFQDEVLLQPIDDLYEGKGPEGKGKLSDIIDNDIIDLYRVGGKRYYFPLKIVTSGFFYDKEMFKKYGVGVPKTWKEFIENGKKMKSQNFPPLALDGTIAFYNAYYYYWVIQRLAGDGALFKAVEDKSGKLWTDNSVYLEAAKLVYELSAAKEDFFQVGYSGSNWPAAQSDWALNKSGSILVGSWIASETEKQKTSTFDIGFFAFPEIEGGKGKMSELEVLPFGFAIPKNAKNSDAAKQFLLYIMKEENQKKFVEMTSNFAPRLGIAYPKLLEDIKPYFESSTSYHRVFDGIQQEFPEWVSTVFYPLDNKLIFGDISPEDFISQISKNSANYWKNK